VAVVPRLLGLLHKESLDPSYRKAARLARVLRRAELLSSLAPSAAPAAVRLIAAQGLGVRTVHALHALSVPDRLAIVDDRRSLTYREADRDINLTAHAIRDRFGIARHTPFVLMAENCAEYMLAWFALFRLGARAIHASYRSRPAELEYLVRHSGSRVILVSEASLETARALARDQPSLGLRLVLTHGEARGSEEITFADLLSRSSGTSMPGSRTDALGGESVVYTSGTTGRPKGAVRDFAAFGLIELSRLLERLPFRAGDRHLVVAPLYHSGAQAFALIHTAIGATVRVCSHFDAAETSRTLARERIHSVFLVPTMMRRLLEVPATEAPATPDLRAVVSGAAEFPHALRLAAAERFGPSAIFDFYGATELGWVTLVSGHEMIARPTTVGRPIAGQQVRILDREGNEVRTGETGMIYVRNEQTMVGYLDDPKATRETRRGEWVTVDDLGRLDEDGYLYLSGRARDMVKSGGVNVYPAEVEEALMKHPAVREAAVIGVPDPEWGERLVAVVAMRDASVGVEALEPWIKERLSGPKVPRRWELVTELPRNATGKVLKTDLRARYS